MKNMSSQERQPAEKKPGGLNGKTEYYIKAALLLVYDILMANISYALALWVRYEFHYSSIQMEFLENWLAYIPIHSVCVVAVFYLFHLYHSIWEYAGVSELARMVFATLITSVLYIVGMQILGMHFPRSCYFFGGILQFLLIAAIRFAPRAWISMRVRLERSRDGGVENIMVIGAGSAGQVIIREMHSSRQLSARVRCVIDDNPAKVGRFVDGVPIVGNRNTILANVAKYHIKKIIFAIPTATKEQKRDILQICQNAGCELQTVPGIYQLVQGELDLSHLRKVEITDLLGREPVQVDLDEIMGYVRDKVILVTGGGGSIGSELCRQIAQHQPKRLIIFDVYENNAYDIQQELIRRHPALPLTVLIGSVRDTRKMEKLFEKYHPHIVYHAAAHKHVPLMEDSPNEAIKNNVFGTYKTAMAAIHYHAEKFVLISTDKAVNPTNIMGASKRICEMIVQSMDKKSDTDFVAVRFGNVLGSNGSVIPLFKKQIEEGGPVTVTHPDIIRYFMTIPEAVSLVLQAGAYAKGGEIFVLDMGSPVKIDDLARNLIRLSGLTPDVDIPVVYTGLRPGEKLYEELLMAEEGMQETKNRHIFIGRPIDFDEEEFGKALDVLKDMCYNNDDRIREKVREIVPTYHEA